MILVDTSIWVEHARRGIDKLSAALAHQQVLGHPFVIGELALGGVTPAFLQNLSELPKATVATNEEVLDLIQRRRFAGRDIGYVDAHLLASARLMGDVQVWTRDKSMRSVAGDIGVPTTT